MRFTSRRFPKRARAECSNSSFATLPTSVTKRPNVPLGIVHLSSEEKRRLDFAVGSKRSTSLVRRNELVFSSSKTSSYDLSHRGSQLRVKLGVLISSEVMR